MDQHLLHQSIADAATLTFARSGGSGGQNVNKVNTRVRAALPVASLRGLTQPELALVLERLHGKINAQGQLCVSVDEERTQEANRRIALARLERWVCAAARLPVPRKKTRPTRASQERRLEQKRRHSAQKLLRQKIR